MLTAIQFHDQPRRKTSEIHEERADLVLSPELHAEQAAIAQNLPELQFGGGLVVAELAGAGVIRGLAVHGLLSVMG